MKCCIILPLVGGLLAGMAACTEVPIYPGPVDQPAPITTPDVNQSNYGGTTLPVAPLAPTPERPYQNLQYPRSGAFDQRPLQVTPAPRANVSSDSVDYWTDPRLPNNRGQWETIRGPSGQPMRVYSTDVDRQAPDAVHRTGLPAGSGFQPADTRWDPQRR